jgi:hypothetical protein
MYAENAQNLLALLETVPSLVNTSGLAVGGRAPDPAMSRIPLPSAWVILADDKPQDAETGSNPAGQAVHTTYVVMIYVPYINQSDLIANQLPLIESTVKAIRGQQSTSGTRWRYEGQKLALINPDRLAYEQRYSLVGFI